MWSECILTATYLINRTPSSVLNGKSPYDLVYGFAPVLSHLRNFGCLCFAIKPNNFDKFSSRSEKCVLLGYSNSKKGYRLYSLDSKQIIVSRDVKFYETIFPFKMCATKQDVSSSDLNTLNFFDSIFAQTNDFPSESPDDDSRENTQDIPNFANTDNNASNLDLSGSLDRATRSNSGSTTSNNSSKGSAGSHDLGSTNKTTNDHCNAEFSPLHGQHHDKHLSSSYEGCFSEPNATLVRKSSRPSNLPQKFCDYIVEGKVKNGLEKVVNYAFLSQEIFCFVSTLNKAVEPESFFEASKDKNWVIAMNEEMEALYRNRTWILTDLPPGRKPIGCKWVYKIKYKSSGEIERYKARLMAKGYSQREGLDYE